MRISLSILFLFTAGLLVSCAAGNNTIGSNAINSERYAALEAENQSFAVNILPPDQGGVIWEGKQLDLPFSVRVQQGKTYQMEIDTTDGRAYRGTVQVIGAGGTIGRHQGYDIRLSRYIMEMLKHERQVSFYLNSTSGRQVLLVTFYAP